MEQEQTPEQRELNRKRVELASLEADVAQRELDLATLRGELRAFEARYLRTVGARYAVLDDLESQIAQAIARLKPHDPQAQERAAHAQAQAQDSARATEAMGDPGQATEFRPSEDLKKLYREVAKRLHPDLATDEEERARRTRLMAEANRAYEEGNEARLQAILREWESSPESVKGEGAGADLVRIIRKIAQVEERLSTIEAEMTHLRASDLYQLKVKVHEAEGESRDLLAEMAAQVDQDIAAARKRLAKLSPKGPKP
jgi:hypothetical protein